jgi:hypothetical protein
MSKPQSTNGSESEFEFVETPKAATPTFEKAEDCGVRTTSVSVGADVAALVVVQTTPPSATRPIDTR